MTYGEKIKSIRLELNMSQEMLARELDVSFATVNRWERMHTEPSFRAKQKFEEFCLKNKIKVEK